MKKTVLLLLICIITAAGAAFVYFFPYLLEPIRPGFISAWAPAGGLVQQVPAAQKYAALTFDDGPSPVYTPQVLAVLRKHQASATFFLLGSQVKLYPGVARDIVKAGHETGVHSYGHRYLNLMNPALAEEQVTKTSDLITSVTGRRPVLFRPPHGAYNWNVTGIAGRAQLQMILWTRAMDPQDFKDRGAAEIADKVVNNALPGGIVLLHDSGGNREQTVKAVDEILTRLEAQGYKFVTVSRLLSIANGAQAARP